MTGWSHRLLQAALLLGLAGCTFVTPSPCIDAECPRGARCSSAGFCKASCDSDEDCRDGYYCDDVVFSSRCELACDPEACPGGYLCDDVFPDECGDFCIEDGDCKEGYICAGTDCELPCRDRSCPNGYTCDDDFNVCRDYCIDDDECQRGYVCDGVECV